MLEIKIVAENRVPITTVTDKKSKSERMIFLLRFLIANDVMLNRVVILLWSLRRHIIYILSLVHGIRITYNQDSLPSPSVMAKDVLPCERGFASE